MLIKTFEDIEAWKKAQELTKIIYQMTINNDFACDLSLQDRLRQTSFSIMSNISKALNEAAPGNE